MFLDQIVAFVCLAGDVGVCSISGTRIELRLFRANTEPPSLCRVRSLARGDSSCWLKSFANPSDHDAIRR
jgi:hypothetical protein